MNGDWAKAIKKFKENYIKEENKPGTLYTILKERGQINDEDLMTEKIDFDAYLMKWLGFKDFGEYQEFFGHFLLHATLSFFLMSIYLWLFLIPLVLGVVKELVNDENWKHFDRDAKLDMLSRCLGSLMPLITLLWSK